MARNTRRDRGANPEPAQIDQGSSADTPQGALEYLQAASPGEILEVNRVLPQWCGGFLPPILVPEETAAEVHEILAAEYGGGTFRIRRKRRKDDGKVVYCPGSAQLKIAGPPKFNGQILSDPNAPAQTRSQDPISPIVLHAPTAAAGSDLSSQLLALVQQSIARVTQPGAPPSAATDLAGVITALAPLLRANQSTPQNQDPFGMLDRLLSMADKLARLRAPAAATESSASEGLLGLGSGSLENLLLSRFLGGQQAPAPSMAPPVQTMQQPPWAVQAPPGHVWHPERGWIPYAAAPAAHAAPGAPSQPRTPNPAPEDTDGEEYIDEPLTAQEIADDLLSREQSDMEALLKGVIERIGEKRPELLGALMNGQKTGSDKKSGVSLGNAPWMSIPTDA